MATRTLTQSQLNNNMSGNNANAIYYATHSGSGSAPVVTGYNPSGNYTTSSGGTTTYHLASPVTTDSSLNTSGGGNGGGSGGGSGSKGSVSDGSYSGSYDTSAYGYSGGGGGGYDYASMIESMLAQQRAAAQSAYQNSMARLEDAWGTTQGALRSNLDQTLNRLKSQYDYSSGVVNDDANKSLREAYINYMLNKRNLNQGLSAMGVSGGATESKMAEMYNNYGNSRNNINTTLAENLAQLLNEYQGNVSNANQLYNSQYADAANQRMAQMNNLESALANALSSAYTGSNLSGFANYASTLAGLSQTPYFNLGSYSTNLANLNNTGEYTPTQNTLGVDSVNTTAGNNMGSVTDYAKWKAMADSLSGQGANTSNIIYQLRQNGAPLDAVYQILGA